MADLKISQLTTGVPLDTDLIPFVDLSGVPVTKKATRADLKGDNGTSATATAGTTNTGVAGANASVTNSGTTSAAIFDFTIPRGDVGAAGAPGAASTVPGPAGNGIASNVLLSTVGLVKTYRITYTDASIFDYTTTDGAAGSGAGDMLAATYDPQTIGADAFDMDNMTESSTKKILTTTERGNIVSNNAKVSDINHVTSELPNVDNTSDVDKPVSAAQQTAIDTKLDTTGTAADSTKVGGIVITGTPTVGQIATAINGTSASWQTPSGGGGFTLLDSSNLGVAGTSLTSGTFSAVNNLIVRIFIPSTNEASSNATGVIRFNSDSGSNYGYYNSVNGGTAGGASAATFIRMKNIASSPSANVSSQYFSIDVSNLSGQNKFLNINAAGRNLANNSVFETNESVGIWGDTNQVTSITLTTFGGTANMAIGTRIDVYGQD